jgi:ankyrin repeat protein
MPSPANSKNFNNAAGAKRHRLGKKLLAEVARGRPDSRKIVKLIDGGADLELCDANGNTPLLLAIKNNHTDAAHFLITGGANVAAYDKDGKPPLLHAVNRRNLDILALLFERNAPDGNPAGDSRIGQDRWDDYIWSLQCEIRKREDDRKGIAVLKPLRLKQPDQRPPHWNKTRLLKEVRLRRS